MEVVHTVAEVRELVRKVRGAGKSVGFVPTMGYLHTGHLALMRRAKERCGSVVAGIFVNPKQFGPREDFDRYPRDMERDAHLAESAGVEIIFNPAVDEMYPPGYLTYVETEKVTDLLCGGTRPGHFRGVTTVVMKLFNIVQPDVAFLGQKDAQQCIVIKKMVQDLNLPLEIEVIPTVREADGLAMSSRNIYLSPKERQAAPVIYRALTQARDLVLNGERQVSRIYSAVQQILTAEQLIRVEYIEIRDGTNLAELTEARGQVLIAVAVHIGRTRLIDNIVVEG